MNRKIFKTGHSLAVSLSPGILREMGLKLGDDVRIELDKEHEQITVRHGKKQSQLVMNLKVRARLK